MNDCLSNDAITKQTGALIAPVTPAPCATLVCRLYTNPIAPSPTVVLSDLTPATFPGYTEPSFSTWRGPYQNLNGVEVVSPVANPTFACDATNTTPSCQGYALFRPDTTVLQVMGQFDLAITPQNGQSFAVGVEISGTGTVSSAVY